MYELGNDNSLGALDSYNDSTKGIQLLISKAIATSTPLRALGAGWSWTKIATAKNGIMLDTKPLNTLFTITGVSVSPSYNGNLKKLLFLQSGNGTWELGEYLKAKNLSLKTSGASNGQTIAGAIGTGAHGYIWLERASAP